MPQPLVASIATSNDDFKASSNLFVPEIFVNMTIMTRHYTQFPPPTSPTKQTSRQGPPRWNLLYHLSFNTPTKTLKCAFSKSLKYNQANLKSSVIKISMYRSSPFNILQKKTGFLRHTVQKVLCNAIPNLCCQL